MMTMMMMMKIIKIMILMMMTIGQGDKLREVSYKYKE